jgi:hypothetical protein
MKAVITLFAFLTIGFVMTVTNPAHAVVYCTYIDYPARCVVRPGIVLRPRVVVVRPVVVAPRRHHHGVVVVR